MRRLFCRVPRLWVFLLVGGSGLALSCGSAEEKGDGNGAAEEGSADVGAASVSRGRELFERNGCPVCHGAEGRGGGRIAKTLTPSPRNFRELAAYKQGSSVEEIARTLEKGVAGGSTMPAYPHLSPDERRSISLFIEHLQELP